MDPSSNACKKCKKKTIIRDEFGGLVCTSCGTVQDFDDYQHHFNGQNDALGTFVRIGSASHKGDFNYKDYKLYQAAQKIEEITSRLGLSSSTTAKVKQMMKQITQGELGDGNWFPIFTCACCYVVLRKDSIPYSMTEIANSISCDLHELGRMVTRVIDFLELNLPEFDIVSYFDKAIRSSSCFEGVGREKLGKMVREGTLLLNCCVKWFLTTGRQPVPVVVAVLVFVAELNQVEACIENVGKELHVGVDTCKRRYKELLETLVKVAQALPWGKNVTVKNIVKNAPMVIMYIEMKSRLNPGKNKLVSEIPGFNVKEAVKEAVNGCLYRDVDDLDDSSVKNESQYFEYGRDSTMDGTGSLKNLDVLNASKACLSAVYTNVMSGNGFVKSTNEWREHCRNNKRKGDVNFQVCNNWQTGKSRLSKKLFFKEILEKNVGFDGLPPSFVAGKLACQKRREKIIAAKQRIEEIMKPSSSISDNGNGKAILTALSPLDLKKQKLKTTTGTVDWEDNIIEILLLHQVKEEEIEQGHYNRMLDLYVFDSENTCEIFGSKRKKRL